MDCFQSLKLWIAAIIIVILKNNFEYEISQLQFEWSNPLSETDKSLGNMLLYPTKLSEPMYIYAVTLGTIYLSLPAIFGTSIKQIHTYTHADAHLWNSIGESKVFFMLLSSISISSAFEVILHSSPAADWEGL